MGEEDFSGPDETMMAVLREMPRLRKKYKLKPTWPNGRFPPK